MKTHIPLHVLPSPLKHAVWVVLALIVLGAQAACTSGGYHKADEDYSQFVWPADNPRVRLEAVVRLDSPRRSSTRRFAEYLTGVSGPEVTARPYAVAWDGNDLFVTDPAAGRVLRLREDGRISSSPDGLFASPVGVAVCDGRVLVTDSVAGGVAVLGHDLQRIQWIVEGLDRPTGVVCDGEEIIVVETAAHRIVTLENDVVIRALGGRGEGDGQFNFPTSVALSDSIVWVGDTLNFRVHALERSSSRTIRTFGALGDAAGDMPRIKGLAVDSLGRLWVTDAHIDQVALFSQDGEYLMSLGGSGSEPGRFAFPAGVASNPDGRVAVVDSLNARIQVFRLVGPEASD